MENVVDRLHFLSATQCDISTELEFVGSHFDDFLRRPDALNAWPFSMLYIIIGDGSLRLESEDGLYDFIREDIKLFGLMEFVRLEYCSTDVMNDFLDILSEHFYEIDASIWAALRARLVFPNIIWKPFRPSVKKGDGWRPGKEFDVPDGIIAHLTRECGGNLHDCHVVHGTSGSLEKETRGIDHTRLYGIRILIRLQRLLLISKPSQSSFQPIATRKKIVLTRGTIGCAATLRRRGLCQFTTQSARMALVGASLI
jgi:hypothetical protein